MAAPNTTVYLRSDMMGNVLKIECSKAEARRIPYAQYANAVVADFIPAQKRTARQVYQTTNPYLLILKGVGHPDPDDLYGAEERTASGCTVARSRYRSCDPRWMTDFDARINPYIAANPGVVVADLRSTQAGFDPVRERSSLATV